MDPQQYKSYISPTEFKNDKDLEIKEEPQEATDEFLITEEYPDYFETVDRDQEEHINPDSEASGAQNEECAEMEMTFYECEICKEGFKSNSEAKRHEKLHAFDKPFHCQSCKICFTGKEDLEKHMRTHAEACIQLSKVQNEQVEEKDECKVCNAKFKRHETLDGSGELFICQSCKIQREEQEKNKRTCEEASLQLSKVQNKQNINVEEILECEMCKVNFLPSWQAKKDETVHALNSSPLCQSCRIGSKCKEQLEKKRTHEEAELKISDIQSEKRAKMEETIVCEMCNVTFIFNWQTKRLETGLASDKSTLCQSCRISLKRKEWLERNTVTHEDATVECVMCNAKFKSKLHTKKQKAGQASGKSAVCHGCIISLKRNKLLGKNEVTHKDATDECVMCKAKFKSILPTEKQNVGQAAGKSLVCHGCRIGIKVQAYLWKNGKPQEEAGLKLSQIQNEKAAEIRKTDECGICEIKFKSSCEAKRHEGIHSFDKPFHCHSCNVGFKDRGYLKNHMKIHKLVSQYRCKDCSLQFIDCHEGERSRAFRNYRIKMCLYCGNTLRGEKLIANLQLSEAQIGELVKMGKLYDCWICQVKFKSDYEAKMHESFHSIDNPYCCHSCCISFGDKRYELHRHMQTHKLASQYRCKDCSLQFTDRNDKDRDRAFRYYRIKMCLYCGNRLTIIENNGGDCQPSNGNDFESKKLISLPDIQQLCKLIRVRTLPIRNVDRGKGRTECDKSNVTDSNTVSQLSSRGLEDTQKLQAEPKQTKVGEVAMDGNNVGGVAIVKNNSDGFEILEGRQQAQSEVNREPEQTKAGEVAMDENSVSEAAIVKNNSDGFEILEGRQQAQNEVNGEPEQTKAAEVAMDRNNVGEAVIVKNNSDGFEILDGRQQAQSEVNKETEQTKAGEVAMDENSVSEAAIVKNNSDGFEILEGGQQAQNEVNGEPEQTKAGEVAMDRNNIGEAVIVKNNSDGFEILEGRQQAQNEANREPEKTKAGEVAMDENNLSEAAIVENNSGGFEILEGRQQVQTEVNREPEQTKAGEVAMDENSVSEAVIVENNSDGFEILEGGQQAQNEVNREPEKAKAGEVAMDENNVSEVAIVKNNSDGFEILEERQQAQNEANREPEKTKAGEVAMDENNLSEAAIVENNSDGFEILEGGQQAQNEANREPEKTKAGEVAMDENNLSEAAIVKNNSGGFEILEGRQQVQSEVNTEINEVYKCEICYVTFGSILDAQRHEDIHTFEKPFYCHSCDRNFRSKYKLKNHMESHKLVSQYRCNVCSLQFPDGNDRDRHRAFQDYRIKMCLYCGKNFPEIEKNADVVKQSSSNDGCDSNALPSVHQNLSRLVPVRTLPLSDMDFVKGIAEYKVVGAHSSTIIPLSSHELEDLLKLKQAKIGEVTIDENNKGEVTVDKNIFGSCEIWEGRQEAQNGGNSGSNELYKCDICYVAFKTISEAKRHENVHTFKKPFRCNLCNTNFKKKYNLALHMEVHKLVSQYKCKECNFQFTNPNERDFKRALKNHHIKSCLYCENQLPRIVYNMNFVRESYAC